MTAQLNSEGYVYMCSPNLWVTTPSTFSSKYDLYPTHQYALGVSRDAIAIRGYNVPGGTRKPVSFFFSEGLVDPQFALIHGPVLLNWKTTASLLRASVRRTEPGLRKGLTWLSNTYGGADPSKSIDRLYTHLINYGLQPTISPWWGT